jgi:RNA polymerase sigma-70 factor (ECF subfamily)
VDGGGVEPTPFASDLADAQRGGERGLTALFRTFHPRLLRYLRAREPTRADDLAGETWLAVAAQIRSFEGDVGAFSAWIFTIARQRLADARRSAARRRTDPVDDVPVPPAGESTEQAGLDQLDAQAAVDFIARNLTPEQADVVLLRTLGDLNAAEVAAILGRDEGWVRVTHHRALKRLRERLPDQQL